MDKKVIHTLRCYAEARQRYWFAHCIDLNISVEGDSAEAARRNLEDAIQGYVETVCETSDEGSVARLLKRSSPFSHWLKYHYLCLVIYLMKNDTDKKVFQPTRCMIPV